MATLETSLRRRFRVVASAVEAGGHRYRLLHPASAEELISEADFDRDERLPYWAELWPAAVVLAGRAGQLAAPGARALELGCGSGLVAAAAARAGLAVTATDYYEPALEFTRVNVWRNARARVETVLLDWRALPARLPRYDVVFASDVLYERPYGSLFASVLARTMLPNGRAVVADPGRVGAAAFVEACGRNGLATEVADRVPYAAGAIRQTIDLYHVVWGATGC